jgi:plastocyanin
VRAFKTRQTLDWLKANLSCGLGVFGLACAAMLLVSACGQPASAGAAPTTQPSPAGQAAPGSSGSGGTFVVMMTDANQFQPASLTIPKGSTVTWKNTSQMEHTVTADPAKAAKKGDAALPDGATPFDSGMIGAGQSYSHTFDVPGTYKYLCIPHEMLGMVGTITVTP